MLAVAIFLLVSNVGSAPVAFDFDAEGRLVGLTLGQVRPADH
ncbi:MAG: hypothetical protein WAU32_15135 [Thermoanaerobaculia bacterium]